MSENSGYYESYWSNNTSAAWTPSSGHLTADEQTLFATYLPPGAVCLDYGCGNGQRYGRHLAAQGVDYRGFDISTVALSESAASGLKVGQLTPDGKTTLPDGGVDTAVCFEVLEHLMEPQVALAELYRCLKPGGHAILSVPNSSHYLQRIEFLLTGFWCPGGSPHTARKEPWRDPHIRFYSPALLRRLVTSGGWEVVQEIGEAYSLVSFPVIWRHREWYPALQKLSKPVGWLGRVFPSLFSMRIFIVARKPLA